MAMMTVVITHCVLDLDYDVYHHCFNSTSFQSGYQRCFEILEVLQSYPFYLLTCRYHYVKKILAYCSAV